MSKKGTMEWRLFLCAECPDEDNPFRVIIPIREGASHEASGELDFCPRCNGYLSFVPWGRVTATSEHGRDVPAEGQY